MSNISSLMAAAALVAASAGGSFAAKRGAPVFTVRNAEIGYGASQPVEKQTVFLTIEGCIRLTNKVRRKVLHRPLPVGFEHSPFDDEVYRGFFSINGVSQNSIANWHSDNPLCGVEIRRGS